MNTHSSWFQINVAAGTVDEVRAQHTHNVARNIFAANCWCLELRHIHWGSGMITRRQLATGICVLGAGLRLWHDAAHASGLSHTLTAELATIERASGGRLGVAVLDTLSGARAGHRADERFPMGSTFKLLAAAAVLARVDAGKDTLDRRITFAASDMVINSPITEKH